MLSLLSEALQASPIHASCVNLFPIYHYFVLKNFVRPPVSSKDLKESASILCMDFGVQFLSASQQRNMFLLTEGANEFKAKQELY